MAKNVAKKSIRKKASTKPRAAETNQDPSAQIQADINRLLSLRHSDPHQLLGVHTEGDELTFRAFRPDAESVEIVVGKTRPRPMVRTREAGLFELSISDSGKVPSYKLRVHEPNGEVRTIRDPYSFLPTIGELDLYLFGEGKHEEIYQKLGAHVTEIGR